jgi:hypothetical protein
MIVAAPFGTPPGGNALTVTICPAT